MNPKADSADLPTVWPYLRWAALSFAVGSFWTFWAVSTRQPAWMLVVTVVVFPLVACGHLYVYRRDRQRALARK